MKPWKKAYHRKNGKLFSVFRPGRGRKQAFHCAQDIYFETDGLKWLFPVLQCFKYMEYLYSLYLISTVVNEVK